MTRVAGAPSRIYVDEFDFSGRTNTAEMTIDNTLGEVTAFADDGAEFVEGIYNGTTTINGFFDPTDDNYDEQMWSVLGDDTDHYVGLYFGNQAAQTNIGYELQAQSSNQVRSADVAGAILLNVSWQNNGAIVRSTVLVNESVTASGAVSGSNQNIGATASGERFVAIFRVLAFDGTTFTIDVEESQNDGGGDAYALISGIQATFTAIGVQRKTTTSATETWKRINVTTFTGTSLTLLVTIGKEQGVS